MEGFDYKALQVTRLAEAEFVEGVADTAVEVALIADGTVRQRCASVRLAAQIVVRAYGVSATLDDGQVLAGMSLVLKRLAIIRQACLGLVGVPSAHSDYGAVFGMATAVALDVVTEEFKWNQIGAREKELPVGLLVRLIEALSAKQERLFAKPVGRLDKVAARRLATLQAAPAMMGLVNLFDYYALDREAMVRRLVYAVASQAEFHAMQGVEMSDFGQAIMVQRAYGVSTRVMVEVFKGCAYNDVMKLRDMQEMDRAILIANFERVGGMSYEHVLAEHDRVMRKTYEMCELIVSAQDGDMEDEHGTG